MRLLIFLSVIALSVVSANAILFDDIANKTLDIASHFINKLKFLINISNGSSTEEAESNDEVTVSPAKRAKVLAENVKIQPEATTAPPEPQTDSTITPAVVITERSAAVPQVVAQVNQHTTTVKIAQQAQSVTTPTVTTAKVVQVSPVTQTINAVPPSSPAQPAAVPAPSQGQNPKSNPVNTTPAANAQVPKTGKK